MAKKHLVVEWLSWLPCKRDFINSTNFKDLERYTEHPTKFEVVRAKVHELVGGPLTPPPPPPLDNVVGSERLRSEI